MLPLKTNWELRSAKWSLCACGCARTCTCLCLFHAFLLPVSHHRYISQYFLLRQELAGSVFMFWGAAEGGERVGGRVGGKGVGGGRKPRDNSLKAVSVVGRQASRHQKTSGQREEIKTGIRSYHVLGAAAALICSKTAIDVSSSCSSSSTPTSSRFSPCNDGTWRSLNVKSGLLWTVHRFRCASIQLNCRFDWNGFWYIALKARNVFAFISIAPQHFSFFFFTSIGGLPKT